MTKPETKQPSAGALAAVEELNGNAYFVRPPEISQEIVKKSAASIIDKYMQVNLVETGAAIEWIEKWVDTKLGKGNRPCGWPNFGSISIDRVAEMVAPLLIDQHTQPDREAGKSTVEQFMSVPENRILLLREYGDLIEGEYREAVRKLVEAAKLQVRNFQRQNLAPEINNLGDDDHEAWTALQSALKAIEEGE